MTMAFPGFGIAINEQDSRPQIVGGPSTALRWRQLGVTLLCLSLTTAFTAIQARPATAAGTALAANALIVSEIQADTANNAAGADAYEFFEVANTTVTDINLADAGVTFSYIKADADYTAASPGTALTLTDSTATVPAHQALVVGFGYANKTAAEFATHYGLSGLNYTTITGQNGVANGGNVGIRIMQSGAEISRSFVAPGQTATEQSVQFGPAADGSFSVPVKAVATLATPGFVDPSQIGRSATDPSSVPAPPVFVSEMNPDNADAAHQDQDNFEFFELATTSGAAIDLTDASLSLDYWQPSNTEASESVPLTIPSHTVIPAHGAVAFWLQYGTGDGTTGVNTTLFTDDDFRSHFGLGTEATVVHASGQSGMSNSGPRAIRIRQADGTVLSLSWYTAADISPDLSAVFAVPTEPGTPVTSTWAQKQTPTPDVVASQTTNAARTAAQPSPSPSPSVSPAPSDGPSPTPSEGSSPSPTPSEGPSPTPSDSPSPTPSPEPTPTPSPSPSASSTPDAPILQISELAPNTANISGSDAWEFIEIYNSTTRPINFGDYAIYYLYPNANYTNSSVALWRTTPADPVIQPGATLIVWIKNGANDALTTADFNQQFTTSLVAGTDIVEVHSGGMANGSARGVQLRTNSGTTIDTAYYNMATLSGGGAEASAVTGLHFTYDPAGGTTQKSVGPGAFSPGVITAAQVPPALLDQPVDALAPTVTNLTGSTDLNAGAGDVALGIKASDDLAIAGDALGQVKTVTLTTANNVDAEPIVQNLTAASPGQFEQLVKAVDLHGKAWLDYTFTVRDGTNTTSLGPVRMTLSTATTDPLRLNATEGQYLRGTTRIGASSDLGTDGLTLTSDDAPVVTARPALESPPVLALDVTQTDTFFQNGVVLGSGKQLPATGDSIPANVLTIFEQGTYAATDTITAAVPVEAMTTGTGLTVSIVAGTKAWPRPDASENNDDYAFSNVRLVLPDGRTLRPTTCATALEPAAVAGTAPTTVNCPASSTVTPIGDGSNTPVYYDLTFTIPDDAFNTLAYSWDTTIAADGAHSVGAAAGGQSISRQVILDNTAPVIETGLAAGQLRGNFTIDATASDPQAGQHNGSGLDSLTATLDGSTIALPYASSSATIKAGEHTVTFTAKDSLGNTATKSVAFTTPNETPQVSLKTPADNASVPGTEANLAATATDSQGSPLQVTIKKGYSLTTSDAAVAAAAGTTAATTSVDRSAAEPLSATQLARVATTDGLDAATSSATEFPYQLFTVTVPSDAGGDYSTRLTWNGSANQDAKVIMSVLNTTTNAWERVDQFVTTATAPTTFALTGLVAATDHMNAQRVITVLIQHSEGYTTTGQATRQDTVGSYSSAGSGATARDGYDFTIGWESDTQYYNANNDLRSGGKDYYQHQLDINRFLVAQRSNLNLQYVIHTGDIIDQSDPAAWAPGANNDPADDPSSHLSTNSSPAANACPGSTCVGMNQWANADAAYRLFDDAKLPYGILAGNHDVGHLASDYTRFNQYFPQSRYSANPWYGAGYTDASGQYRGHYDLISANGVDLLILSMGWGAEQSEINWMNSVIARYPERKVIIDLHEYLQTTGGRGPVPAAIFTQVVTPNSNVIMVLSGHYHDAYTRTDALDDNGDGTTDRTVYSMLFDYQGLAEGGLGYLRLLHFDNAGGTDGKGQIIVRTYSPSLDTFDSADPSLAGRAQEFAIPYSAFGLKSVTKTLATDSFTADILTSSAISPTTSVVSGGAATATWTGLELGSHGWYVQAENPYGGITYSPVRSFTTVPPVGPAAFTATPTPTIAGTVQVGGVLTVEPGTWSPTTAEVMLSFQWLADGLPIPGATATQLPLSPTLIGKRISVAVTAVQAGFQTTQRVSTTTAAVAAGRLTNGAVTVTGQARVGATLRATTSGWAPADIQLSYQWYADGVAVATATRAELTVPAAVVGKSLTVHVTGTATGYANATSVSSSTATVAQGATQIRMVKVSGKARVGSRLTVKVTGVSPQGAVLRYQWYAGGKAVSGATKSSLKLGSRLIGKKMKVKVTVKAPGYGTVSHTSTFTAKVARRH